MCIPVHSALIKALYTVYMNSRKKYIELIVRIDREGRQTPVAVVWEDGRQFPVRKVLDRRSVITAAGGAAVCYTCLFGRKRKELYREKDRWYILTDGPAAVRA